jgi:F0F1-type ATP synthase assembly protein I
MEKLRAFFEFWYDFVVGDDWRVASTVVVALCATVVVDRITGSAPWWIPVGAVLVALPASIYRVMRSQRATRPPSS